MTEESETVTGSSESQFPRARYDAFRHKWTNSPKIFNLDDAKQPKTAFSEAENRDFFARRLTERVEVEFYCIKATQSVTYLISIQDPHQDKIPLEANFQISFPFPAVPPPFISNCRDDGAEKRQQGGG